MNTPPSGVAPKNIPSGPIIGIDLGTSTSAIAFLTPDGEPELIQDLNGDTIVPSMVQLLPDGQLVVGSVAKSGAVTYHDRTAMEVKRLMGTGETVKLGKKVFFPEEIGTEILKHLKQAAEAKLNREVKDVVISVPARFENSAREATRKAAEAAGLEVIRLINEPTAAALAYGLGHIADQSKVLVFDFGGGTLDVTVLEMFEGILDIRTSVGDDKLGGKDIDEAVMALLRDKFKETTGKKMPPPSRDRKAAQRIKEEGEIVKKTLSFSESVQVNLPNLVGDQSLVCTITRDELDAQLEDMLMRAMAVVNEALARARLKWDDIDVILPIGGSSRIPMFRRALQFASGKELYSGGLNPDEAVALGAAIAAGIEQDLYQKQQKDIMILDVSPHRLGVATIKQVGSEQFVEDYFSELIPKDAKLPAITKRDYMTLSDGTGPIAIRIYEAVTEGNLCREHRMISELALRALNKESKDEPVQVEFRYTLDGTLEVAARYISAPMVQVDGKFVLDAPGAGGAEIPQEVWRNAPLAGLVLPLIEQVERQVKERPDIASTLNDMAGFVKLAVIQNDEDEVRKRLDKLTDLLFELT
ncbi:Hsp70 family protein [Armatimonas rosea]|uniref:Molecular chaperone DnaK n=1 Tax=Armatimonas rosea TaxID=685828 RepID=A0A7W9SMC2_ARMRO|nr:Hsp70 family protein [Armatimonas rosea]MBB6049297.1 molecular chaperone DnaK [Armatimonas rosea]